MYIGIRGDNIDFQSSRPNMIWCFNKPCMSRWNPFTYETETISCGKWLYTHINPSALRLSTSRNSRLRMSTSCLSCSLLPALVFRRCAVERLNTSLKWFGPLSSVQRWISPSIAISRLHVSGARLKWNSASSADIPSSAKNLSWNLLSGAKMLSQAW